MIVAIDGPAGAGKSTVARAVADALGIGYLDTGAMYRALTLMALRDGVAVSDGPALADLARRHPVELSNGPGGVRVHVRGDDVTMAIREGDVTGAVSEVAAHPAVRHEMVARQRQPLRLGVPHGEGEDALQAMDAVEAVASEQLEQDLGVAFAPEIDAARGELMPQCAIVIELAVIGDREATVG